MVAFEMMQHQQELVKESQKVGSQGVSIAILIILTLVCMAGDVFLPEGIVKNICGVGLMIYVILNWCAFLFALLFAFGGSSYLSLKKIKKESWSNDKSGQSMWAVILRFAPAQTTGWIVWQIFDFLLDLAILSFLFYKGLSSTTFLVFAFLQLVFLGTFFCKIKLKKVAIEYLRGIDPPEGEEETLDDLCDKLFYGDV